MTVNDQLKTIVEADPTREVADELNSDNSTVVEYFHLESQKSSTNRYGTN